MSEWLAHIDFAWPWAALLLALPLLTRFSPATGKNHRRSACGYRFYPRSLTRYSSIPGQNAEVGPAPCCSGLSGHCWFARWRGRNT